ncbi:MAG TPA: SDR family NAD(P)-dependent oxidoreductase [Phenylobacterium sp.]|nr:SDR family NAD(P)-dependent oxidoreductase [Phenylobacterium sp.]
MPSKFKPLAGQVVVVSGATSGIGLEAARLAAKAGAAVVLAGTDEAAVRRTCEEIGKAGGRCHPVAGDVGTAEGCDRVARAAAARFGRIDSWIEAGGAEAALGHVAGAIARHIGAEDQKAALVGFGRRLGNAALAELKQAKGKVAATMIRLPKDWRHDSPAQAAAEAALHAVTRPMGHMVVATHGKRLTTATEVKKHPGVVAGVGLLALAGIALWFGRARIARAATAVRPKVVRAVRPAVIGVVKRRPLQAAKLAVKYPKPALKLVKALR